MSDETLWQELMGKYGQYVSGDVSGSERRKVRLQTFYADHASADRALSRISDEVAGVLRPVFEGFTDQTGAQKYHVAHDGHLTPAQIREYLLCIYENGGEIYEVLA